MPSVMLDLETLGREPGCIVLSIGAVTFDPFGTGHSNEFYRNIDRTDCLLHGLHAHPETAKWWSEQSKVAQEGLLKNPIPLKQALDEFSVWFKEVAGEQVWCQGASFDAPILQKAIEVTGAEAPWTFWNVRDTRTVYDVCAFNVKSVVRRGTYHNALDDAKHQVKCIQAALKKLERQQNG